VARFRIVKAGAAVLFFALSVVFLAFALRSSWAELTKIVLEPAALATAGVLSLAYGLSLFIPFGAWYWTLRRNSPACVPALAAAYIYCLSNIAKYLPGNVLHFAGRQILGARVGWSHLAVARATLLEICAMTASICMIALTAAVFAPADSFDRILTGVWESAAAYRRPAALAILGIAGLGFLMLRRLRVFQRLFGVSAGVALQVMGLTTVFFCLYAAMAVIFVDRLAIGPGAPPGQTVALAYLIAWLAGFVVPGAPGGLGVRESVLVLLLAGNGEAASTTALALAFGMRFVSLLGDALCAGIAFVLGRDAMAGSRA
jgi:hypothetical protein